MFIVGEILLVLKDIQAEEILVTDPYLSKGSKVKVINILDEREGHLEFHVLLLSSAGKSYHSPNGIFVIIQEDIDSGSIVGISRMRDDKICKILEKKRELIKFSFF